MNFFINSYVIMYMGNWCFIFIFVSPVHLQWISQRYSDTTFSCTSAMKVQKVLHNAFSVIYTCMIVLSELKWIMMVPGRREYTSIIMVSQWFCHYSIVLWVTIYLMLLASVLFVSQKHLALSCEYLYISFFWPMHCLHNTNFKTLWLFSLTNFHP